MKNESEPQQLITITLEIHLLLVKIIQKHSQHFQIGDKLPLWSLLKISLRDNYKFICDKKERSEIIEILKRLDELLKSSQTEKILKNKNLKFKPFYSILIDMEKYYDQLVKKYYDQKQPSIKEIIFDRCLYKYWKTWKFEMLFTIFRKCYKQYQSKQELQNEQQLEQKKALQSFFQFLHKFDGKKIEQISQQRLQRLRSSSNCPNQQNIFSASNISRISNSSSCPSVTSFIFSEVQKPLQSNFLGWHTFLPIQNINQGEKIKFSIETDQNNILDQETIQNKSAEIHKSIQFVNKQVLCEDFRIPQTASFNKIKNTYSQKMFKLQRSYSRFDRNIPGYKDCQPNYINQNQNQPLIKFLNSVKILQLLQQPQISKYQDPSMYAYYGYHRQQAFLKAKLYGSFYQRQRFYPQSNININITADLLKGEENQFFENLLKKIEQSIKNKTLNGYLGAYLSQDSKSIIMIHAINNKKTKTERYNPNIANQIHITLNNSEHVSASTFIGLLFDRLCLTRGSNLLNFLQLIFKKNKILMKKNMLSLDKTNDQQIIQEKANIQNDYLPLSTYSLQMMVIFYLQKTFQIPIIKLDQNRQIQYFGAFFGGRDIKILQPYQNLVNFLKFYSQNGDYLNKYQSQGIDVIQRSVDQKQSIKKLLEVSQQYLFRICNPYRPRTIEKIIQRHSVTEDKFFSKIKLLMSNCPAQQSEQQWNPQVMLHQKET